MGDSAPNANVRFFTSASMRPIEEIAGEVVQWLPRWITVEFEGTRPVTGVWQSAKGRRRICWYAEEYSAELACAHVDRYGDEPFWIVDRTMVEQGRVSVIECDAGGKPEARREWTFDQWFMPTHEEERSLDGATLVTRDFDCVQTGLVIGVTERRPGLPVVERDRPIEFPIPELAGEPFLCGSTITDGGPRLIEPIAQNEYQGRFFAVYREGSTWKRGVATIASRWGWPTQIDPVVNFRGDHVAPLVKAGELVHPWSYSFVGVVEALPEGHTLDDVVLGGPLDLTDALTIASQVAAVARRAHEAGHQLGGIRPELTYVRRDHGRWSLSGIMHRGAAVLAVTRSGEAILSRVFPYDFSSRNDADGLAKLVWFALTGGHPSVAPRDIRRPEAWSHYEYGRAKRQPWTGPATIGPPLERMVFDSSGAPDFESFVEELVRVGGELPS